MVPTGIDPDLPAFAGGEPLRKELLPYGHQVLGLQEEAALIRVARSPHLTCGMETDRFEQHLAGVCGARKAVALSSGTTALHACLRVLGIGPGDEVVVPAITFVASCNAAIYVGARPVIADVLPDTLTLCPESLERAISPQTRAVVVVHFAGHTGRLAEVLAIARRHGLAVVEDAAHALGTRFWHEERWVAVGSLPDTLAAFSFHPVKLITTGEGGAVTTASSLLEARLRLFRHHGIDRGPSGENAQHDRISALGMNGRMSELQAALGRVQLDRMDDFLARRRSIARVYLEAFAGEEALILPVEGQTVQSSWNLFVVRLVPSVLGISRDDLLQNLRMEGICPQVHYVPLHYHPHVQRHARLLTGGLPVAEQAYAGALTLPLWPGMTDGDISDVIQALRRILKYRRR